METTPTSYSYQDEGSNKVTVKDSPQIEGEYRRHSISASSQSSPSYQDEGSNKLDDTSSRKRLSPPLPPPMLRLRDSKHNKKKRRRRRHKERHGMAKRRRRHRHQERREIVDLTLVSSASDDDIVEIIDITGSDISMNSPIRPDFSNSDDSSSCSSVASAFNNFTIKFESDVSWGNLCKGTHLNIPRALNKPKPECVKLINSIRNGIKNVCATVIDYEDRIISIIIAATHIMESVGANNPQSKFLVLIVSSRRHVATEIHQFFSKISSFYQNHGALLIGGMQECIQNRGAQLIGGMQKLSIISGTPGKLCQMIRNNRLNKETLSHLVCFVMESFDELQKSDFPQQMRTITHRFPDRSIRVISLQYAPKATNWAIGAYNRGLNEIGASAEEKRNIQMIDAVNDMDSLSEISDYVHVIARTTFMNKEITLMRIIKMYKQDNIVIFTNSKKKCKELFELLSKNEKEHLLSYVDGDCTNEQRSAALSTWKVTKGMPRILLTTDLLNEYPLKCDLIVMFGAPVFDGPITYLKRCKVARKPAFIIVIDSGRVMETIAKTCGFALKELDQVSGERRYNRYTQTRR